jgi:hypothetical protein
MIWPSDATNLLYHFLPRYIVPTFVLQQYIETLNKQFPSLATVVAYNASIIIYFLSVVFLNICRRHRLIPFSITVEPKSRFFLSL